VEYKQRYQPDDAVVAVLEEGQSASASASAFPSDDEASMENSLPANMFTTHLFSARVFSNFQD